MDKLKTQDLSVVPTKAEIEAWNRLTREEQLAALRAELEHPDCTRDSAATMSEIRAKALADITRLRGVRE